MNINNIKKEFPIFDEKIQNNDLVYLDSANSSQKPRIVVDRIYDFYTKEFSNVIYIHSFNPIIFLINFLISVSVIFSTTSSKNPFIKSSFDCW